MTELADMSCGKPCNCPSYGAHLKSISFSTKGMPGRSAEATRIDETEARWSKDMDAYHRIRQDGEQPRGIDGAAQLEARANEKCELETGQLMTKSETKTWHSVSDDLGSP